MYDRGVNSVSAFVLAGGKSSRMGPGKDKALMTMGGQTLLEHALRLAKAVGHTGIVGSASKLGRFGPVIEDVYPGQGPLAGIHAALAASATGLNLIIAVDMPFLSSELLSYVIARAHESTAAVVVPRTPKGLQPLAAVYRRAFRDVAERALRDARNKITPLFSEVECRFIEPEELQQNGFSEDMFRNLNTEQDWLDAQDKLLGPRKHL